MMYDMTTPKASVPTITARTESQEDIDVTPEYCFKQAATILSPNHMTMSGGNFEVAREWRLLGITLRGDVPRA